MGGLIPSHEKTLLEQHLKKGPKWQGPGGASEKHGHVLKTKREFLGTGLEGISKKPLYQERCG